MKKVLFAIAMAAVALTMVTGCSSSSETDEPDQPATLAPRQWTAANSRPDWHVDWSANVAKPQWKAPNSKGYEYWMLLMVRVQDELLPYVSSEDLMSVSINGETRVVTGPAHNTTQTAGEQANNYFLLKILGNEDSDDIISYTLSYYNAQLKQLFEMTVQDHFIAEKMIGVDEDLCIDFLASCKKYPVRSHLTVMLPDDITPTEGDMIGVFVGEECRGVINIGDEATTNELIAYGREEGEQATIVYYSQTRGLTSFDATVKLSDTDTVLTLK